MKQISLLLFLFAAFLQSWSQNIPARPVPPKLVNDYTGTLTPEQIQHLESKLVAFDDTTSIQIAVVLVPTLQDYDAVDYATKLGRDWGVGNKKTNNGVVVLLSMEKGKRKVFISPGYGLEGALSDFICNQIVEASMIPQFKQGNYFRGISDAADAIIQASKGEYKAPEGYHKKEKGGGSFVFIVLVIIVIVIISIANGGGSGGGGSMTRRGFRHLNTPFFFFPSIGGGSSSGGGWGGGSSGGGGFGGFGGGSFGGGGAGGSW